MEEAAETAKDETPKTKITDWILLALLFYFGLAGGLYFNQKSYLYSPDVSRPDPAKSGAADMQVISVTTSDGLTLQGWYRPPAGPDKPVIIQFHGDGGNIGDRSPKAHEFTKAGYGFLLAEYRGYGGNPGAPSEKGIYADAHAYIDWLAAHGVPQNHVVLYGESFGTGVAVQMALDYPQAKALVLESAYTTLASVDIPGLIWMPVLWVVGDKYDNESKIGRVAVPVLMMFGDRDAVVPPAQGRQLFDLAHEPKKLEIIPDGGHADLFSHGAGAKIISFLGSLSH